MDTHSDSGGWEERFIRYFSANALDGEDVNHKGTMIAPSLAVDVAEDFIRTELATAKQEGMREERERIVALTKSKKATFFESEFDQGYDEALDDLLSKLETPLQK